MSGGRGHIKDPVKVVIIDTQYVETDAVSFKSVVQSLTGKESTVAVVAGEQPRSRNEVPAPYKNVPVFERGMSFRDLDRMLKELPPLDELYGLYADN